MSSETKADTSTTKPNENSKVDNEKLIDKAKRLFYANYKTEKTVTVYSVIMLVVYFTYFQFN